MAKGYNQKCEINYLKMFSPVVKMNTVRVILALAVIHDWKLFQLRRNLYLYTA